MYSKIIVGYDGSAKARCHVCALGRRYDRLVVRGRSDALPVGVFTKLDLAVAER